MAEYLDVLDDKGNLTGKKKTRDETHRLGSWHRCAHIWIVNPRGELIVQKRSMKVINHPGKWSISSAGHVVAGENSLLTAQREVMEELGIQLQNKDLEYLFSWIQKTVINNGTYINNEFDDVYLVTKNIKAEQIKIQKNEVAEIKFIHFCKLESLMESQPDDFVPHKEEYQKLFKILKERFPH